jgi:UDP-N-acetylglucosamine:LPS N-acetylglucosamine transferase
VAYEIWNAFSKRENDTNWESSSTGNRYRKQKREAIQHFNLDSNKKTVLVLGGSLGARRINQLIEKSWQHSSKCSSDLAMWKVVFRRL